MDFKPDAAENKDIDLQPTIETQPPVEPVIPVQPIESTPYEALETEPATAGQAPASFGMAPPAPMPTQPESPGVPPLDTTTSQFVATPPLAPVPFAPAPAKSKKKKIFIGVGVALLMAGISASAFASYRVYQSPEVVMMGAVSHLMQADHIQANTIVTSDQVTEFGGMSVKIKKVTVNNKTDYTPANGTDAEIELTVNDKDYKFGGSVINIASGDIYFKLDGIVSTVEDIVKESGEMTENGAELNVTILKELEGKWVKFAVADMKKLGAEYGDTYKCTLDAYKQYGTDKAMTEEVINAYRANQFITTKGDAKYTDGMIGYDVELERQKLKDFTKAFQKTAIYKKVAACDKTNTVPGDEDATTSDSIDETIDEVDSAYSSVNTLWFGQWTHELRQFDSTVAYTPEDEKPSTTKTTTMMSYDETVTIEPPKDAMSFEDFQAKVMEGYEQMTAAASAS